MAPRSSPRPPLVALKDVRLQDGTRPLFEGVDLAIEPRGAPRGRAARVLSHHRPPAPDPVPAAGGERAGGGVAVDSGAWYRMTVGESLEVAVRADHPAARSLFLRQRVAEAVARILVESAEDAAR